MWSIVMERWGLSLDDFKPAICSGFQVLGFENLVFAIFEFVHALVETPKFKGAVKTGLSELMYYIVLYMQVNFLSILRSESRE